MYNGCSSCGSSVYGRSGGFSWIIWVIVILFVLGLFDNNGCGIGLASGCDNDNCFGRNNGCGCGCN